MPDRRSTKRCSITDCSKEEGIELFEGVITETRFHLILSEDEINLDCYNKVFLVSISGEFLRTLKFSGIMKTLNCWKNKS